MIKNRLSEIFDQYTPNTPMSEDESKIMISILLSDKSIFNKDVDDFDKNSEEYKQIISIFQAQIFLGRLKALTTLKISFGCLILILEHIDTPGKAVMYSYYMFKKLSEYTFIDINVFTSRLFPWGYFSDEQLNEIWNKQKIKEDDVKELTCIGAHDNLIDYKEIWTK